MCVLNALNPLGNLGCIKVNDVNCNRPKPTIVVFLCTNIRASYVKLYYAIAVAIG